MKHHAFLQFQLLVIIQQLFFNLNMRVKAFEKISDPSDSVRSAPSRNVRKQFLII